MNGSILFALLLGVAATSTESKSFRKEKSPHPPIPQSIDWRTKGIIPPVRNQGQIGDAAGFAFLDGLESLYAIRQADKLQFASDAQLLACCGTSAHLVDELYACVLKLGGLCSNSSYVSKPDGTCNSHSCTPIFTFEHEIHIMKGSERALESAVAEQPVLVAIDAQNAAFRDYRSGVFSDPRCKATELDHVVLAVGYGATSEGQKYWILKNSWGVEWGDRGYIYMAKDANNMCGVASYATFPH